MAFSLYAATVPSFLQIIGSVEKLVHKAQAFVTERDLKPEDIIQARLAPDMLPFTYQVKSTAEHSIGAIKAIRVGLVSPSLEVPPDSFSGLFEKLASAQAELQALDPDEINGFVGQDMRFEFKGSGMDFTAEGFLMSYAQPNFYFHATTAYDILRNRGVKIGKMDFLGRVAVKQ
jgi:uncharacterized protein